MRMLCATRGEGGGPSKKFKVPGHLRHASVRTTSNPSVRETTSKIGCPGHRTLLASLEPFTWLSRFSGVL